MVNSAKDVPVKILRDTGSSETFVLESVWPFSTESYTGSNVLIRSIGLNVMSVPLHKLVLQSDLIQGVVEVAVRSCLPVEGVQVILGNDLAGERVWWDDSPHLVVTSSPMASKPDGDENFVRSLNALPSCVITRSMSKILADET